MEVTMEENKNRACLDCLKSIQAKNVLSKNKGQPWNMSIPDTTQIVLRDHW